MIDEPELHFHPQIQKRFLQTLKKTAKDFKLQFILVTHSVVFIDFTTIKKVFRFSKGNYDDTLIARPNITEKDSDLIRFLNYTNSSKIFFADKIILVEGQSDEYFYRFLLDNLKMKYDSNNEDIEVLNIEGKNNFSKWREFLDKFGIKYYYLGDMDNIFDFNLTDLARSDYESMLINSNTDIQEKLKINKDFRKCKDFRSLLWKYMKNLDEWNEIQNRINLKYNDNVYILQDGELEDYLGLSSKSFENLITFCDDNFSTWFADFEQKSEIKNIMFRILDKN